MPPAPAPAADGPHPPARLLQTEHAFTLPYGYVDERGTLHRDGEMRLATAMDEVAPLSDGRVRSNQGYLGILLLSRVIVRLGSVSPVGPEVVERLFSTDFSYLQDFYVRLNDLEGASDVLVETECPGCGNRFVLDVGGAGTHAALMAGDL